MRVAEWRCVAATGQRLDFVILKDVGQPVV
jgi:hypothetical protein